MQDCKANKRSTEARRDADLPEHREWECGDEDRVRAADAVVPGSFVEGASDRTVSASRTALCSESATAMASAGDAERGQSAATGLPVDIDDLIRDLEDVGEPPPGTGFRHGAAEERELPPLPVDRSPSCSHLPLELVEDVYLQLQRGQRGVGVPYRQMREILRMHKAQSLSDRQSREHITFGCFPVWWRRSAPVAPAMPEPRQRSQVKSPVGTASTAENLKGEEKEANILRTLADAEPQPEKKARSSPSFKRSSSSFKRAGSVGSIGPFGPTPSSGPVGRTGSFGPTPSSGAEARRGEGRSEPSTPLDTLKESMRISFVRSGRYPGDTAISDEPVVPLRTILEKPAVNASTPSQRRAKFTSLWGHASAPSPDSSGAAKRGADGSSSHRKHSDDCSSHTDRSAHSTRRRQCSPERRASAPIVLRPPVTAEEVRQTQLRLEALQAQSRYDANVGFGGFGASPYQGDRSGRVGSDKPVLTYHDSLTAGTVCGKPTKLECDASGRLNAGGDSSGRFSAGSDSSKRGTHAGYAMSPVYKYSQNLKVLCILKVKTPLYIDFK